MIARCDGDSGSGAAEEFADNGQAQASTARAPFPRIIEPGEALENPLPILWRDAWTVVTDADHGLFVINLAGYLDPGTGVPHRVVDQIPKSPA